jgi:sugar lactone lactonase YvrE
MVVDGDTLLLAETPKERITAFTIGDDRSLHDRRVWADLAGARPDGIALDADGGLWVASPGTFELLRVVEGGRVTDRLDPPNGIAQACALGGDDGRTLFVCSTTTHDLEEALHRRAGQVVAVEVAVGRRA